MGLAYTLGMAFLIIIAISEIVFVIVIIQDSKGCSYFDGNRLFQSEWLDEKYCKKFCKEMNTTFISENNDVNWGHCI